MHPPPHTHTHTASSDAACVDDALWGSPCLDCNWNLLLLLLPLLLQAP